MLAEPNNRKKRKIWNKDQLREISSENEIKYMIRLIT